MSSLNKVQLIGNLTRDPEVRQTPNGTMVCNIGLATNRFFTSNWERQEQAEFHEVVLWGKLAETAGNYLKKWAKAYIEWRLQTRSWEDQTGTKRYKTEIIGESLIMLGAKWEGSYSSNDSSFAESMIPDDIVASKSKKVKSKDEEEINIEDIPF